MSVVTAQARRRWLAVAAGVSLLVGVPATVTAAAGVLARRGPVADPQALVRAAVGSDGVAYQGLATSRGNLGVPDLPAIDDVPARLGGRTDTRVWWGGPRRWRVDVLSATGEQGLYGGDGVLTLWDYERGRLTRLPDAAPVRLPRADDLLPPQAARRMLGGTGPRDRVSALPARRIAGTVADGVRVVPAPGPSTIGHLDVWIEPGHGLPVAFAVVDRHGVTALESRFSQLTFGPPEGSALTEPAAAGADRRVEDAPDLAARIQRLAVWEPLPDRLAGLPGSLPVAGAATYGNGLTRFLVLPIPTRLAGRVTRAAVDGGGISSTLPGGRSVAFSSGAISLVVVEGQRAYVLAGLVTPAALTGAAAELVAP